MRAKNDFRTPAEEKTLADERTLLWNAINALTKAELLRLKAYAAYRVHALGYLGSGLEAADLLHEAIAATVDKRRPWKKDSTPLFAHLHGVMRSIASGWAEKGALDRRRRVVAQDSVNAENSIEARPIDFESFPSHGPNPESLAGSRQLIESLILSLDGDIIARKVLVKMMDGWQDKDIPAELGMARREYEAAKKRIQRRFQKITGTENG